jgi:hypothetical protein
MTETAQQTAKETQKSQTFTAKAFAAQSPTSGMAPFTLQTARAAPAGRPDRNSVLRRLAILICIR